MKVINLEGNTVLKDQQEVLTKMLDQNRATKQNAMCGILGLKKFALKRDLTKLPATMKEIADAKDD